MSLNDNGDDDDAYANNAAADDNNDGYGISSGSCGGDIMVVLVW